MARCNVDQLANALIKEMEAYEKVTLDDVKEVVTKTAKETAEEINSNAASVVNGNKYSKSWAYKRDPNLKGKYAFSMVVYSKPPYYRIAHLLEKGHAKVNGGRVHGRPHIAPAEELAKKNLQRRLEEKIGGTG